MSCDWNGASGSEAGWSKEWVNGTGIASCVSVVGQDRHYPVRAVARRYWIELSPLSVES